MQTAIDVRDFKNKVMKNYTESEAEPDTVQYDKWLFSVKATIGALGQRPWDLSIYKVPKNLQRLNEDAYTPRIVSIGPFHQHKQHLLAMEEHKWRYMLNFLRRKAQVTDTYRTEVPSSVLALDKCGDVIANCEKDARACYAENIDLDKYQLAEVLLVDGCFILELFIRHAEEQQSSKEECESFDDPIISNSWMVPTLEHDLALLENQIPFFILEELFNNVTNNSLEFPLVKYALLFFSSALNLSDEAVGHVLASLDGSTYKHITHMLYQVYKPKKIPKTINEDVVHNSTILFRGFNRCATQLHNFVTGIQKMCKTTPKLRSGYSKDMQRNSTTSFWGFKKCARQLYKKGVRFQVGDYNKDRLLNIEYDNGVIKIPQLYLNEATESIFRNLIAFEQCSSHSTHYMASYAILMKSLIRSSQDVDFLTEECIVINKMTGATYPETEKMNKADADKASTLFKELCMGVVYKDFYFDNLCREVNSHHKPLLHYSRIKGWARVDIKEYIWILKNEYFRSPWSITAFIAASLLFIFTVLQTFNLT